MNPEDLRLTASFSREGWSARDLDDVSIGELYEACHLRVPVAEAHLPHREDALGTAVMEVLDGLRMPLRDQLKQRVSSVYDGIEGDLK